MRTRLSRLHPYPAMVADELAIRLSNAYVNDGMDLYDPFCGSGRFLAATAHLTGLRVGTDVNPLACLLSRAKLARLDNEVISDIAADCVLAAKKPRSNSVLSFESNRNVSWFARSAMVGLSQIVRWLNRLELDDGSILVVGAALSATARDVSYVRKSSWKLHRLSAEARKTHRLCPWTVFQRRLFECAEEIAHADRVRCQSEIVMGDSRLVQSKERFDLVITSPPYGDSRSTVQYGAASEISLPIVARVRGLGSYASSGRVIDRDCLGGKEYESNRIACLRPYWAGSPKRKEARGVRRFLQGFSDVCDQIATAVKPDGRAIFVLARRSTGGFRVKLDDFTRDQLSSKGFVVESSETRTIRSKKIPYRINKFAGSKSRDKRSAGRLPSMKEEIVLVFRRRKFCAA